MPATEMRNIRANPHPGIILSRPPALTAPFVFNSPHSGRDYTREFRQRSRLDARTLRLSEDCYVDELFADAPAHGMPLIAAGFPRAYVDVNREPYELDPDMFSDQLPVFANTRSERVRAGLGSIPRIVSTGLDIYDRKLVFAEEKSRLTDHYMPYHQMLAELLEAARERFGWAALIDCHSMPSSLATSHFPVSSFGMRRRGGKGAEPDIVLGDRRGASCAPELTERIEAAFAALGYRVERNTPYSGGYCTVRYGDPANDVHAIQIEVSRRLYMCEKSLNKNTGNFARVKGDIGSVIRSIAEIDLGGKMPMAAE